MDLCWGGDIVDGLVLADEALLPMAEEYLTRTVTTSRKSMVLMTRALSKRSSPLT